MTDLKFSESKLKFPRIKHPQRKQMLLISSLENEVHKTVTCREWRYQRPHVYNCEVDLL